MSSPRSRESVSASASSTSRPGPSSEAPTMPASSLALPSPLPLERTYISSMPEYDVAIIGSGPGGYVAAIRAAQLGLKAVVIEKDNVGGLCLNWGCIPSKALLYSAELINLFQRGPEFGIGFENLTADLNVSVSRSRDVVARFVGGVEQLLQQNKVTLIKGTATVNSPT